MLRNKGGGVGMGSGEGEVYNKEKMGQTTVVFGS